MARKSLYTSIGKSISSGSMATRHLFSLVGKLGLRIRLRDIPGYDSHLYMENLNQLFKKCKQEK